MNYTAPCVRFLMQADRLGGEVGALEIESFVGLYEIARADSRVLFGAASPPNLSAHIKNLTRMAV
jgi:hypothetical protein